jgi:protein-tyrosine-phosphatase
MVRSVLFVCNMNSVRSPMAAALLKARAGAGLQVDSAGLHEDGYFDTFVQSVLGEVGASFDSHEPKSMRRLNLDDFDVAVALTPEAAEAARRLMPADKVEYWPIENPSDANGGLKEALAAYRSVRDALIARIDARFSPYYQKP